MQSRAGRKLSLVGLTCLMQESQGRYQFAAAEMQIESGALWFGI